VHYIPGQVAVADLVANELEEQPMIALHQRLKGAIVSGQAVQH